MLLDDWQKGQGNFNAAMQQMDMSDGSKKMNMDYNLFTINGLAFPDTETLNVKQGDIVRVRLINASASTTHPMHLHGQQFKVVSADGNELPESQQYLRNTTALNPGEIYDIEFTANNPGVWAFHCHELHHAGGGMMTLLKYEGYNAPATKKEDDPGAMPMNEDMPGMDM